MNFITKNLCADTGAEVWKIHIHIRRNELHGRNAISIVFGVFQQICNNMH